MKLSDETIRLLENIVENEYVYRITSLILTGFILIGLVAWFLYEVIQTKKTNELREE